MTESVAGIKIPDTKLVGDATELVRQAASPLIFNHSRRVFLFGSLQGKRLGLTADPELLYVGAMFHDLGLTDKYGHTNQRFELDGADEARRFLTSYQIPDDSVRKVWTGIALHTTPEIPYHMEPEVALVTAGVETDVLGIGYHDLKQSQIDAVVAAHPRPDFKRQILEAFTNGIKLPAGDYLRQRQGRRPRTLRARVRPRRLRRGHPELRLARMRHVPPAPIIRAGGRPRSHRHSSHTARSGQHGTRLRRKAV